MTIEHLQTNPDDSSHRIFDPELRANDHSIEVLLREVGARAEPAAQLMNQVRPAVHAEWRALVEHRMRRRVVALSIAAGLACAAAVTTVSLRVMEVEPVPVATIVRIDGELRIDTKGAMHEGVVGEILTTGENLHTSPATLVALNFGNGLSLRVAADSKLQLMSDQRVALDQGTLYVDSGSDAAHAVPLTVQTAVGTVRHVGTQYQVRTIGPSGGDTGITGIEVSIREGRVEIGNALGTNTGSAGERLSISTRGTVLRGSIAPRDSSWQWAADAAPAFDIANRSLSVFLRWAARETGRQLTYADRATQTAADHMKLGGSIAGLTPDTALAAVLSTTKLRRIKTKDEIIGVALAHD